MMMASQWLRSVAMTLSTCYELIEWGADDFFTYKQARAIHDETCSWRMIGARTAIGLLANLMAYN